MSKLKFVLPFSYSWRLVIPATLSFAKPEYSKTTGAKCTVCHTKGRTEQSRRVLQDQKGPEGLPGELVL